MSFVSSTRTCNEPIDWGMSNKQRIHGDGYGRYEYPAEEEPDKTIPPHLVRSQQKEFEADFGQRRRCLLYTSPSPRDRSLSRMPSSA